MEKLGRGKEKKEVVDEIEREKERGIVKIIKQR